VRAEESMPALTAKEYRQGLSRLANPLEGYAITVRDEAGVVWFLSSGSSLHGSMIRTRTPYGALVFPSIEEACEWLRTIPEHWSDQLTDRVLEVCLVGAEIHPAAYRLEIDRELTLALPVEQSEPVEVIAADPVAVDLLGEQIPPPASPAKGKPRKPGRPRGARTPAQGQESSDSDSDMPDKEPRPLASVAASESAPARSANGMAGFQPSPQQSEFLRALREGQSHVLLEARAGSGKSTTCRAAAWDLHARKSRSVYACFNRAIATEFQRDLPPSCRAATLHSLGMALIKDALGEIQVDEDKLDRLIDPYFDRGQRAERACTRKLADYSRNLLLEDLSPESLLELAADNEIEIPRATQEDVLAVVPELLSKDLEQTSLIDFTDMIWLPVRLGLQSSKSPEVLFVDEAQDLNACQHALVDLLCPDGRLVVVGDRWQSIYAFRGADSESIPNFERRLVASGRGLETYPLTVTRRCPRRHVELARQIVSDLDHLPGAIDGTIDVVHEDRWQEHVRPGDLVLCRTNAPLVSACYRLVRQGVKATVSGRDIGKGLQTLILRMRASSVAELLRKLGDYRAVEAEKICQLRNPEPKLASLNDRVDCLIALCEGTRSVDEVRQRAESLFSDVQEASAVQLSSVHRAKGLERSRVVILRPDLLPGPWARRPADVQQERNLTYVAITRAREELIFAGSVPALLHL
jgi:superfamily I DNA/RNA helicase